MTQKQLETIMQTIDSITEAFPNLNAIFVMEHDGTPAAIGLNGDADKLAHAIADAMVCDPRIEKVISRAVFHYAEEKGKVLHSKSE